MTTRQIFALIAMFGVSAVSADDYVKNADANGDGFVSLYELRAAYYADPEFNKRIEQSFDDYDRNGDGLISGVEQRAVTGDVEDATNALIEKTNEATHVDSSVGFVHGEPETASEAKLVPIDENRYAADSSVSTGPDVDVVDDTVREFAVTSNTDVENGQRVEAEVGGNSRTVSWLMEIDTDNSGGASIAELVASGEGKKWFTDREFSAADKNSDGDLNTAELDALVRSLERRHR